MEKIIVMGLAESGKTTIVKTTAEGFVPQKKAPYSATIDYKRKTYTMFGKKISLFDLGGQKSFLDRFVGDLAEFIFTNVSSLIYVFDIVNMPQISLAKYYYDMGLKTLLKYSPEAKVTILFHKMDMIDQANKGEFLTNMKDFLDLDDSYPIYETSVYDRTIFDAMENIISVTSLEPASIEGIVQSFEKEVKEHLQQILLLDDRGNPRISSEDEIFDLKEKLTQAHQTLEATFNINESINYSFHQFKSKLVFTAFLNNYHSLLLIYKANQPINVDEQYSSLLNHSLQLMENLNKVIK